MVLQQKRNQQQFTRIVFDIWYPMNTQGVPSCHIGGIIMTQVTWDDLVEIAKENQENQQNVLANTFVEFPLDVNKLDPLVMLRYAQSPQAIDDNNSIASQMLLNKTFVFKQNIKNEDGAITDTVEVLKATYTGGNLPNLFGDAPWLLDMLYDVCRGLVLKNLTPRSASSRTPSQNTTSIKSSGVQDKQ